jgi:hypothetical protein
VIGMLRRVVFVLEILLVLMALAASCEAGSLK